jgi:hypothetical protein
MLYFSGSGLSLSLELSQVLASAKMNINDDDWEE